MSLLVLGRFSHDSGSGLAKILAVLAMMSFDAEFQCFLGC